MIVFNWNLSDFKDKVKDEDRNFGDVVTHYLENIPQFLRRDFDKINRFWRIWLFSDEILIVNVVILAQELHELEGPSVGHNTFLVVQGLVCVVRLRHILSHHSLGIDIVEIIVVSGVDPEVLNNLFFFGLFLINTFSDQSSKFSNQESDILENFIVAVTV